MPPLSVHYAGPLRLVDHTSSICAVLLLALLCAGLGRRALRLSRIELERPIDSLAFSVGLGAGLLGTILLGLGAVHALGGAFFLGAGAFLVTLVREDLAAIPRLAARALGQILEPRSAWTWSALAALALVALWLLVTALAPPTDWDALMYHLRVPAQLLREGRLFTPEDNLYVYRMGVAHMLYLPLLETGLETAPSLFSALIAVLLGLTCFSVGEALFGRRAGALAAILLWTSTAVLLVAVTPRVDVTLTFLLLLAHYAVLLGFSAPAPKRFLLLAGALLGFGFGTKYFALPYVVGLSPVILWMVIARAGGRRRATRWVLAAAVLFSCVSAPWLVKNATLVGSPLFPLFTERVPEPWLVPVVGDAVPESVDPELYTFTLKSPATILDAFFAPSRISVEGEGALYYTSAALLLLPLWALFWRNRALAWLLVPGLGFLASLLIPFPQTNPRFWLPGLVPLTLGAAGLLSLLAQRLPSEWARGLVLAGLCLAVSVPSALGAYIRLNQGATLRYAAGLVSSTDFRTRHLLLEVSQYGELIRDFDRYVPPEARVLLIAEARGFYFRSTVLQDNALTNWPMLASARRPGDCLERAGFSHVLIGVGAIGYYVDGGLSPDALQLPELTSFIQECLTPVHQWPAHALFARGRAAP